LERVASIVGLGVERHGGRVCQSQGEGDSAVAVFAFTLDAVAAAVSVNELMASEAWPGGERVAVRSAVHAGSVTQTKDGVFGLEVHRCARLRALGQGGEVVVSAAAVERVEHELPAEYSLYDRASSC
jgi:class 3 adenylate cyclase